MNPRPVRFTVAEAWTAWVAARDLAAREWLLVHYASLIKYVAGRVGAGLPKRVDTNDLVSAGMFGLIDAIERFDPANGAKFETFAVPRIRGAILDSLRSFDWVPRSVRARSRRIQDAITELEREHGRSPSDAEIAAHLSISTDELDGWLTDVAAASVGPLDHVAADTYVADDRDFHRATTPHVAVEADELRSTMRRAITSLPDKERRVLLMYYEDNLTLAQIGEVLDVSESRVSQIHAKAVLQMRAKMAAADYR